MSDEKSRIVSEDEEKCVVELSIPAEHPMTNPVAFGQACEALIAFAQRAMKLDEPAMLTLFIAVTIGLAQRLGISPRMLTATFTATVEGVATGRVDQLVKLMDSIVTSPGEKGKVH